MPQVEPPPRVQARVRPRGIKRRSRAGVPAPDGARRRGDAHVRDSAPRKGAEDALLQSQQRLRALVTNAPVILFALDAAGVYTLSEGAGLAAIGRRPGESVGRSVFDVFRDDPELLAYTRRALAGESVTFVSHVRDAIFDNRLTPLRDDDGRVSGAIGISTDITERARAEEALRASEERFRALSEHASDLVCILAPDGRARYESPFYRRVLGQTLAELQRRHGTPLNVIHPEDRPTVAAAFARVAAPAAPAVMLEFRHRHADGSWRVLEAIATNRLEDPALGGIVVTSRDVTARKADEARLAEARATELALREANRRMNEFIGVAGHELRTPLTAIVGNVQVLRGRLERHAAGTTSAAPTATSDLDLLARVERQVGRLRRLVDDLLDVARIEADQLELRLAPCDLGALVRDAVQEQRVLAPERAIDLETPPSGVPVIVHADADRVGQVVTNYLTNALKYAPAEAPIAVGVRVDADEGMARVWVRDEGPGLTPDEQARVWDRFYRVKDVAHRHGSGVGLGLGLAICHTLVERQGGALGVESACGQGCTFWFTLPLAHAR